MGENMSTGTRISRFVRDYGMLGVLLLLCLLFSVLTLREQSPTGAGAAKSVMASLTAERFTGSGILIVGQSNGEDSAFAQALEQEGKAQQSEHDLSLCSILFPQTQSSSPHRPLLPP
jgi:hypothetical protein